MSDAPESNHVDTPPAAAPASNQPSTFQAKIDETVQALRQLEAQEAYLMQELEKTRVQTNRVRGRLDTLIELAQEGAIQSNGAPRSQAVRPERGRPRRK